MFNKLTAPVITSHPYIVFGELGTKTTRKNIKSNFETKASAHTRSAAHVFIKYTLNIKMYQKMSNKYVQNNYTTHSNKHFKWTKIEQLTNII